MRAVLLLLLAACGGAVETPVEDAGAQTTHPDSGADATDAIEDGGADGAGGTCPSGTCPVVGAMLCDGPRLMICTWSKPPDKPRWVEHDVDVCNAERCR